MNKKLSTALRFLHSVLAVYTFCYFITSCLIKHTEEPGPLSVILMLPIIIYSFVAYIYSKRYLTFFIFQVPTLILTYILGGISGEMTAFVLTFAVMILCQGIEIKSPLLAVFRPCGLMIGYYVVVYLIAIFYGSPKLESFVVIAMMVEILIYIFYENNEGLHDFLDVRQNVSAMPYRQIILSNSMMLSGVILLLLVIFVLTSLFMDNSPLVAFVMMLGGLLRTFFRWLIGGEDSVNEESGVNSALSTELVEDSSSAAEASVSNGSSSTVLEIAIYVILVIMGLFLLYIVIRSIWSAITDYIKNRAERKPEDDETEDEVTDIRDDVISTRTRSRYDTEGNPIRKRYKREIRRKRRENRVRGPVEETRNPTQIEEDSVYVKELSEEEKAHWKELHDAYEETRYGKDDKS